MLPALLFALEWKNAWFFFALLNGSCFCSSKTLQMVGYESGKKSLTTTINLFFPFSSSNCHPDPKETLLIAVESLEGFENYTLLLFCCFGKPAFKWQRCKWGQAKAFTQQGLKINYTRVASEPCELLALLGSRPQDSWSPAWHMAFPILPAAALFNFLILFSTENGLHISHLSLECPQRFCSASYPLLLRWFWVLWLGPCCTRPRLNTKCIMLRQKATQKNWLRKGQKQWIWAQKTTV